MSNYCGCYISIVEYCLSVDNIYTIINGIFEKTVHANNRVSEINIDLPSHTTMATTSMLDAIMLHAMPDDVLSEHPLVLPPMLVSTCVLGLLGIVALCVRKAPPNALLGVAVVLRRAYLYTTTRVASIYSIMPFGTYRRDVVKSELVDGCRFIKAVVCEDGREQAAEAPCDFASVARCVCEHNKKIRMWYAREDNGGNERSRQYIVTYDPSAVAKIRCPPHVPSSDASDCAEILTASLTVVRNDGECQTYDVSDDLRHHYGPDGDFHRQTGGVLTARGIMPRLDDDVCFASIIYYDGSGVEHTIALPYPPPRELSESVGCASMSQQEKLYSSDDCGQSDSFASDSKQVGDGLALRIPGNPTDVPIVPVGTCR